MRETKETHFLLQTHKRTTQYEIQFETKQNKKKIMGLNKRPFDKASESD